MPKVSVIIPTYNRAGIIGKAIQSVLDQTYSNWELIVVDDGSQDNTREVVAAYNDPRIKYICQENTKSPGARNTGIRASTGHYIAFLDSDDSYLPEKLQQGVFMLDQNPGIGLVASGWNEIDGYGSLRRNIRPWQLGQQLTLDALLFNCPFPPSAVLVRKEWLFQVNMFDAEQYYVEDWDLWLRLAYAGCEMAWVKEISWLHVVAHSQNSGNDGNRAAHTDKMIAGLFRLLDKFFAQSNLPSSIRARQDKVYARAHVDSLVRAFGAGLPAEGEKHMAEAIRLNPDLLEGNPPAILHSLASTALTPQVTDRQQYVTDLCQSLPRVSRQLTCTPRQMWGNIRAVAAFDAFSSGRRQQARIEAAKTLLTDPSWVGNRGLLSILFKPW